MFLLGYLQSCVESTYLCLRLKERKPERKRLSVRHPFLISIRSLHVDDFPVFYVIICKFLGVPRTRRFPVMMSISVLLTLRRQSTEFKNEAVEAERRRHTSSLRSQLFSSCRGCENAQLIIEN